MSSSESQITKNAIFLFAGVVFGNIGSFVFQLLVAREFGPNSFGIFSLALLTVTVATSVSLFGLPDGLIAFTGRLRSADRTNRILGVVMTSLTVGLGLSVVVTVILILLAPWIAQVVFDAPKLESVLRWFPLLIPANVLISLFGALFLGYERAEYRVFVEQFTPKILLVALTLGVIWNGGTIIDIGTAYVVSRWVAGLAGIVIGLNLLLSLESYGVESRPKKLLTFSAPLLFTTFISLFLNWTDTFFVGYYKSPAQVGIYQTAFLLGSNISIFLGAISGSLYPNFASLISREQVEQVRKRYANGVRWSVLLTVPPSVYLIAFPESALSILYGTKFESGSLALVFIVIGNFVTVTLGPATDTLKSMEQSKYVFACYTGGLLVNVLLNVVLVPRFGIVGAALSTAFSGFVANAFQYQKVKRQLNVKLHHSALFRSSVAALVTVVPLTVLHQYVDSARTFLLHICLFVAVYLGALYLLGGITWQDVQRLRKQFWIDN